MSGRSGVGRVVYNHRADPDNPVVTRRISLRRLKVWPDGAPTEIQPFFSPFTIRASRTAEHRVYCFGVFDLFADHSIAPPWRR